MHGITQQQLLLIESNNCDMTMTAWMHDPASQLGRSPPHQQPVQQLSIQRSCEWCRCRPWHPTAYTAACRMQHAGSSKQ